MFRVSVAVFSGEAAGDGEDNYCEVRGNLRQDWDWGVWDRWGGFEVDKVSLHILKCSSLSSLLFSKATQNTGFWFLRVFLLLFV